MIKHDTEGMGKKIFGFNSKDCNVNVLNLLITVAKNVIWLRRNIAKYEKRKADVWSLFKNKMETTVESYYGNIFNE